MFQYYYPNTLNYIGDRADCDRLISIRSVTYALLLLYFSQKQLPSAWNESDWLANCRPIHIENCAKTEKGFLENCTNSWHTRFSEE